MRPFSLVAALLALALGASAAHAKEPARKQTILLDGVTERVNWNDGDSFRILGGRRDGQKARLAGYNTLESYGPVHFWGGFTGWDLYHTHKDATALAKSQEWECTSDGSADGYGRILVACPELRKRLISEGLAHVYAYGDEVPDPELIALQLKAQNERNGMWAKGIPRAIVTSVHSIDEPGSGDDKGPRAESYNRVCDTATGKTYAIAHTTIFKPCDAFCFGGSCLLYIPFKQRYGKNRVACVIGDAGDKNRVTAMDHLDQPLVVEERYPDR
ncbi:MAG: nuclease [Deltaproteobacteria bacterium]|nr:MAG: nuclease [Deltaproteobacteria bacterium]